MDNQLEDQSSLYCLAFWKWVWENEKGSSGQDGERRAKISETWAKILWQMRNIEWENGWENRWEKGRAIR